MAQGFAADRDRIVRLGRELGVRCKQKRQFRATTNSNHDLPVAENLLKQTFAPTRPHEAWVTDITYVATDERWLYLAGIKEVFTSKLSGYAMDQHMTQRLTATALWKAVRNQRTVPGLIHHSDRGSQYRAHDDQKLVKQFGMKPSMSRRGNCYDNAPMESFWDNLKSPANLANCVSRSTAPQTPVTSGRKCSPAPLLASLFVVRLCGRSC